MMEAQRSMRLKSNYHGDLARINSRINAQFTLTFTDCVHVMLSFQHITVRCFITYAKKKTIYIDRLMMHCYLTRKTLCSYKLDSF